MPEAMPPKAAVGKDAQLISELIRATQVGKVRWIPTANLQEFTASFRGKFSVIVSENGGLPSVYKLRVEDELGNVLHTIEGPSVKPLLELASRPSARADRAIDEILEALKSR
jgi:hypothetical protein